MRGWQRYEATLSGGILWVKLQHPLEAKAALIIAWDRASKPQPCALVIRLELNGFAECGVSLGDIANL